MWYHIDETHDDPVYEDAWGAVVEVPYASHSYFLKSVDAMQDHIVGGINDWVYYTDENVTCDDSSFESGYVFDDLAPTRSVVSYKSGRYKIDVSGISEPFWTDSIMSTKLFVTDLFEDGRIKKLRYYANDAVTVTPICAEYNDDGKMISFNRRNEMNMSKGFVVVGYPDLPQKMRMFHWLEDKLEPLCRVISTK